jgi:hypothetical protein
MSVVESLKAFYNQFEDIQPCGFTDLWSVLAAGEEAQTTIKEVYRERLVGRLIITVKFIDGSEYDVTISDKRKWV